MAYTASTWSAIRLLLQQKVEGQAFWDNQEALDAFNEGLQVWNLLTGTWRTTGTMTTTASTVLYTLPSTLLYNTRLTIAGRPLISSSWEELFLARRRWTAETITDGGDVPTRITVFAPFSLTQVFIWPADGGGTTLTVEGIAATPVLREDGDTVDSGTEQLDVLLGYALHVLSFKKGGAAFAATNPLFTAFLAAAADTNDLISTSTVYRRAMGLDQRDLKPARSVSGASGASA